MCLKFRGKITSPYALVNLIDDDFGIVFELSLFTSNIKREVCGVLDSLFFFEKKKCEARKAHKYFVFDVRLY
jgi:hypothetical protein